MIIAVPQLLFLSKSAVACKFQDLTQILGEQAHTCVFFNLECWFVLRSVHNMACKFQDLTQILGEQAHTCVLCFGVLVCPQISAQHGLQIPRPHPDPR
jgi:hypothetical protein